MNSTGEMGTQWMNLMQALPSMKLLQKMVAVTAGMVVIVWMIAYWDTRRADIVCDESQHLVEFCQRQPFIDSDRAKSVFQRNELTPDR
jgi:hypothetical protein